MNLGKVSMVHRGEQEWPSVCSSAKDKCNRGGCVSCNTLDAKLNANAGITIKGMCSCIHRACSDLGRAHTLIHRHSRTRTHAHAHTHTHAHARTHTHAHTHTHTHKQRARQGRRCKVMFTEGVRKPTPTPAPTAIHPPTHPPLRSPP